MTAKTPDPSREVRLAAKLRENLRRRKQQARAQGSREGDNEAPATDPLALPKDGVSR